MSRAVELAKKTGCSVALDYPIRKPRFTFFEEELEAFSHASRAEALREAEAVCRQEAERLGQNHHPERALDCAEAIRAMADREGK